MTLDPQVKRLLEKIATENAPDWHGMTPEEGRQALAGFGKLYGEREEVAAVEDRIIKNGVRLRVYKPAAEEPTAVVVYFHGGGWVLGDLDTHDTMCRSLTNRTKAAIVSVDYRLSPEFKFPSGLEDCYSAVTYVYKNAASLGVDPDRLAVVGDSAGGNLAAAVTLLARDRKNLPIRFQGLICPVMDFAMDTNSYRIFAKGFGLTRASMQWFWQQYLKSDDQGKLPLASPLQASDLSGLPPTLIVAAQYDILRDEAEKYANQLQNANVPIDFRCYEGMVHGFVQFGGVIDLALQAIDEIGAVIQKNLSPERSTIHSSEKKKCHLTPRDARTVSRTA